jgi:egghead protein (zeste-white 4 protein)
VIVTSGGVTPDAEGSEHVRGSGPRAPSIAVAGKPTAVGEAWQRTSRGHAGRPAAAAAETGDSAVWPSLVPFLLTMIIALGLSAWAWWQHDGRIGALAWVTTVLWTIPLSSSLIGLMGCRHTRHLLRTARRAAPVAPVEDELLLVVVPTIGRLDTYPALERVVRSYCEHLPSRFHRLRVDIVIEENCPARDAIVGLGGPLVRIVTVPATYTTPAGTRFKARANHYANELRIAEGEGRDDVWVLHMDDDTGVGPDTATELARFVDAQRGRAEPLHLAQGVLTFPRQHAVRPLIWMADAIRPSQDLSLFAITTGRGSPHAGLHGELLLVRARVEADIGWDFGPRAVVEDSQFALHFVQRHPGRSGWFPGRSFGATPASFNDFLRQRERWAWGLLELASDRRIPLRNRLLLIHNMIVWSCGPLQHIGVVVVAGSLLGDLDTFPAVAALLPLWAINVSFQVWTYWEGMTMNVQASGLRRARFVERLGVLGLIPLFSLWETAGFLRGFVRFVRHGESAFAVIAKPR